MAITAVSFASVMMIFRQNTRVNIAVTVIYVFGIFLLLRRSGKKMNADQS